MYFWKMPKRSRKSGIPTRSACHPSHDLPQRCRLHRITEDALGSCQGRLMQSAPLRWPGAAQQAQHIHSRPMRGGGGEHASHLSAGHGPESGKHRTPQTPGRGRTHSNGSSNLSSERRAGKQAFTEPDGLQ